MREPITLPRNPSKSFIAANPQLYAKPKAKDAPVLRGARKESPLEAKFYELWQRLDPKHELEPRREYKFNPTRKWKLDFAWPAQRVFVETDGGVFSQGRHNRPQGHIDDATKRNDATFLGWVGFTLCTGELTEEIVTQIQDFIRRRC